VDNTSNAGKAGVCGAPKCKVTFCPLFSAMTLNKVDGWLVSSQEFVAGESLSPELGLNLREGFLGRKSLSVTIEKPQSHKK